MLLPYMKAKISMALVICFALLYSSCIGSRETSFFSNFSVRQLVERSKSSAGLTCDANGGGGGGGILNSGAGLLRLTQTVKKKEYLASLDMALEPLGFCRRRNHREWSYPVDDANELWIHINFGKAVVNPSGGVKYLDLVSVLPKDAAPVTGAMSMLRALLPSSAVYTIFRFRAKRSK